MSSNPKNILNYWAAVEKITPFEIESSKKFSYVRTSDDIPWLNRGHFKHKKTEKYTWVYTVYLGVLPISYITKQVNKLLNDDKGNYDLKESNAVSCIARFLVNFEGKPIAGTFELPGYYTGISNLAKYGIKDKEWLNKQSMLEYKVTCVFHNFYKRINQEHYDDPVTLQDLEKLLQDCIEVSYWPNNEDKKCFKNTAVIYSNNVLIPRADENGNIPEALDDSTSIINSFFIEDLKYINKKINLNKPSENNIGRGLKEYLGINLKSEVKEDLSKEKKYTKKYTSPDMLPPARWPGKGNYPLYLAQQLGVNLALDKTEGIFSINGPPGTGKTTLFRDIISNIITKRAMVLAKLNSPNDAYKNPTLTKVGNVTYKSWHLIDELLGHEIFVASSNNGAVENISKEIPKKDAVDSCWDLDFFSEVASHAIGEECWGLGAAPLGNKKNRSSFFFRFWSSRPINEGDLNIGLKYLLGKLKSEKKLENWEGAVDKFQSSLRYFEKYQNDLSKLDTLLNKSSDYLEKIDTLKLKITQREESVLSILQETEKIAKQSESLNLKIERQKSLISDFKLSSFSWFEKLKAFFNLSNEFSTWKKKYNVAVYEIQSLYSELDKISLSMGDKNAAIEKQKTLINRYKSERERIKKERETALYHAKEFKEKMHNNYPDAQFWEKPDQELHMLTPWLFDELHRIRAEVFINAINLHKAFIYASSENLMNNLVCMNFIMQSSMISEMLPYLSSIWASFFLVVPVASTTFASFANLCNGLSEENIGWLLIDEAGQASPQAAVGAIWRSKRTIVVGDPLQIKPVVTIPRALNKALLNFYQVSAEWDSFEESVQTLSDRINKYGTYIGKNETRRWIGCPLRVHRRCNDPMFSIANGIAYDNLMIQATQNKKSVIEEIFPESIWIDVASTKSDGNWIIEEGKIVVKILKRIILHTKSLPLLYIISPYKKVSLEMRKTLKYIDWQEFICELNTNQYYSWINKSVGTIHTFQGKQAEAVILLLGGNPNLPGSIDWAAREPNILNVGVTRAKNLLIVVGNHARWSQRPYFQDLSYKVKKCYHDTVFTEKSVL